MKHKPVHPLALSEVLNAAALDHVIDMASNSFFGHDSSDGTDYANRIRKRCGESYHNVGTGENIGMDFPV